MKIALASDLHLEFGPLSLKNTDSADLLILSGDIVVAKYLLPKDVHGIIPDKKSEEFHEFFREVCAEFKTVIYVAGNHEHYNGDFGTSIAHIREMLSMHTNLYIMDKESMMIDGYEFVAGTLWTDMNKEDPQTLMSVRRDMNDYRIIDNSLRKVSRKVPLYKKDAEGVYLKHQDGPMKGFMIEDGYKFKEETAMFSPEDSVDDHKKFLAFLNSKLESGTHPIIVVGHHAPCKLSTKPRYKYDVLMNGAYSSDLSELMLDNPRIKLWTHGHTHDGFDYMMGSTRIACNPRGYIGHEQCAYDFKLKYLEV